MTSLLYLTTILQFLLGLYVLWKAPKNSVNIYFCLLAIGISFWALTNALFQSTTDPQLGFTWAILAYTSATLMAFSLAMFTHYLTSSQTTTRYRTLLMSFAGISFMLPYLPGLTLREVTYTQGYGELITGPALPLLFCTYLFFVGLTIYQVVTAFPRMHHHQRQQLKYIALGLSGMIFFGILFNLVLPAVGNYQYVAIGPLFTLPLLGFVVYAIIRHRFLDIRIAMRSLIHSALLMTLMIGITLVVWAVVQYFLINTIWVPIVVSLCAILCYQPLHYVAGQAVDSTIFQREKSRENSIRHFSKRLSSELDLLRILHFVQETFESILDVKQIGFILIQSQPHHRNDDLYTHLPDIWEKYDWRFDTDLGKWLLAEPEIIVADDIESSHHAIDAKQTDEQHMQRLMQERKVSILAPLIAASHIRGYILIGAKHNGMDFTSNDIQVVEMLSYQAAVAIHTAQQYQTLNSFNHSLKSKIKEATTELIAVNADVQAANKLKTDLLTMIAHELRTPMTIARNGFSLLKKSFSSPTEAESRYIHSVDHALQRLGSIIENTNKALAVASGKLTVDDTQPVNINEMLEGIVEDKRAAALEQQVIVSFKTMGDSPLFVLADAIKLRYVFWEIVTNAIKFGKPGTKISVTAVLITKGKSQYTQVRIADTGKGMSLALQRRVMRERFAIEDVNYKHEPGLGLGLYLCKKIVGMHQGDIMVDSKEGEGTMVTILLPAIEV